jgi:deazaflavin-dependent oxidoreductase (nitroreductase family)
MAKRYTVTTKVRLVNRFVSFLASREMGDSWVLTTTGRKSGQRRDVPVTPVEVDGHRYIVAPYGAVGWVKNIRANPHATLRRGSATVRISAVEVSGEEAGAVLARYYAENQKYVTDYMDIPGDGTITDFISVTDRYPVFRAGA